MYAVIRSGGKQYRVVPGQTVRLEKLTGDAGSKIELGNVLAVEDGGKLQLGSALAGAIEATILQNDRTDKIIVFKKKRKKQYRRTRGHRQDFTAVRIDKILV